MTKEKFNLFLILITVLISQKIIAQIEWMQTNGPLGGHIWDQVYCNNSLYTTSNNGVFVSLDNGNSFSHSGLRGEYVLSLTSDSSGTIYASTKSNKFFRKDSSAQDWVLIPTIITGSIIDLEYHFSGNLLALSATGGFYISSDRGNTWLNSNHGLIGGLFTSLLVTNEGNIYLSIDDFGIFISEDLGREWSPRNSGLNTMRIFSLLQSKDGNLYAGAYLSPNKPGGVYKSTNLGQTWIYAALNYANVDCLHQIKSGYLFAGTTNGFFRSTDGVQWIKVGIGLSRPTFLSISSSPNGNLFVGSFEGFYKSENSGNTFTRKGLVATPAFCFVNDPSGNIFAGSEYGVFKSSNLGNVWMPFSENLTETFTYSMIKSSVDVICCGTSHFGIFRYNPSSFNWSWVLQLFINIRDFATDNLGNIYAASDTAIFKSSNNGLNWYSISSTVPNNSFKCIAKDYNSKIFTGTLNTGILCSTDEGQSWYNQNNGLTNQYIYSLLSHKNGKIYAGTKNGIFHFQDGLEQWIEISGSSSLGKINDLISISQNEILIATSNAGVWHLDIENKILTEINSGLQEREIISLAIDESGYVFAGTQTSGAFRTKSQITNVFDYQDNNVISYTINNYPNPFNLSTTIRFSLPGKDKLIIIIYDALGNEIAKLLDEEVIAGTHSIPFNARDNASGIYICTIISSTFTKSVKMILLK